MKTVLVPLAYHFGISITKIPPYFGNSAPGVNVTEREPSLDATILVPPEAKALIAAVGVTIELDPAWNYVPRLGFVP